MLQSPRAHADALPNEYDGGDSAASATDSEASAVSPDYPVVCSEFIAGAYEIDMDAVATNGEIVAFAILLAKKTNTTHARTHARTHQQRYTCS